MTWRVGAAQLQDVQGDMSQALEDICLVMDKADREGVDVICFPECFLQGYTLDGATTKVRALELTSSGFEEVLHLLKGYEATIILGLIERQDTMYFNTAVVIRHGKLIGTYRKVHLFENNFQPGTDYPVFSSDNHVFGINICYDARFSNGAAALAKQGAGVIFYPLNNRLPAARAAMYREQHILNLIERAKETGCWVVSSDAIAQDTDYTGYGCTAIVSPDGTVISQVKQLTTGFITSEIPSAE